MLQASNFTRLYSWDFKSYVLFTCSSTVALWEIKKMLQINESPDSLFVMKEGFMKFALLLKNTGKVWMSSCKFRKYLRQKEETIKLAPT